MSIEPLIEGGTAALASQQERNRDEMESNQDTTPKSSSKKKKKNRWGRVKKKWNRKGVIEIDPDHHRYELLNCIREGIIDVVRNHTKLGPKSNLETDDYTHMLTKSIQTPSGQTFEFCSYASAVFATLRRAVGLSEENFLSSIAPSIELPYLEFISNSKGGQDFFLTNDKAYFLKTEKKYYVDVFLDFLGEYLNHFLDFPHSLLVKFLGLYSVKISQEKRLYFYVMQSIFYPDERIEIRYDVKGCLSGRFQQPRPPGDPILTILKDRNFLDETIHLGSQREWFLEQLQLDVEFLVSLGVQDYSLLIGQHPLHPDEKKQDLGDFVKRVKMSIGGAKRQFSSEESVSKFKALAARSISMEMSPELLKQAQDEVEPAIPHVKRNPIDRSVESVKTAETSLDSPSNSPQHQTTGQDMENENRGQNKQIESTDDVLEPVVETAEPKIPEEKTNISNENRKVGDEPETSTNEDMNNQEIMTEAIDNDNHEEKAVENLNGAFHTDEAIDDKEEANTASGEVKEYTEEPEAKDQNANQEPRLDAKMQKSKTSNTYVDSKTMSKQSSVDSKGKSRTSQNKRKPLLGKAPLSLIDTTILDEMEVQNKRLLPDSKNPLHVIDGPQYRYYLGIIDFLTIYECRQRTGRMIKNVKFACGDHSTIPPQQYGERFLNFIREHTS